MRMVVVVRVRVLIRREALRDLVFKDRDALKLDTPFLAKQLDEGLDPTGVVGVLAIDAQTVGFVSADGLDQPLLELRQFEQPGFGRGQGQREYPGRPWRGKRRRGDIREQRREIAGSRRAHSVTFATPIIASRVTSAASSSSVIDSVPAGRSGSTK